VHMFAGNGKKITEKVHTLSTDGGGGNVLLMGECTSDGGMYF
jgi:hypothetical protein